MTSTQIKLPAEEIEQLKRRIEDDYSRSKGDHYRRMERFARAYRSWRARVDDDSVRAGDGDKPNFHMPLIKWHVQSAVAAHIEALFGPDADITAEPTGPVDAKIVRKVSRYMRYTFMSRMNATLDVAAFEFRRVLLGRAFAYIPWVRRTHKHGTTGEEIVAYEGPRWINLNPDDVIVPSEEVASIHDFSFVIRRSVETFDELVIGEQAGRYQNIAQNRKALLEYADEHRVRYDRTGAETREHQDEAEGVNRADSLSGRNGILVYHWYGRWRMLRGKAGAAELDLEKRETTETDLVVKYIPELKLIVGVQDLRQLYPEHDHPRPIVEAALLPDGSYWGPGFFELLEEIEREMTAVNNLGVKAGEMSVAPPGFYSASTGIEPEKWKLEPGILYPVDDPRAVNFPQMRADLSFPIAYGQELKTVAERLTGRTDLNMGRTQAGPNAPRTLGQTQLLLEQGDIRSAFDLRTLRESMRGILRHIWELSLEYLGEHAFFRITEEEAGGLFSVHQGFASLDAADRTGHYDFDLTFATSRIGKEALKERQLALYQIDIANPLIVNNPRALYHVTAALHRAFGDEQFERLVPKPPDDELSLPPDEEHTLMLQGEDVSPRPGDNDQDHLVAHDRKIKQLQQESANGGGDPDGLRRLVQHYHEQIAQLQQKRLMQTLMADVQKNIPALLGGLGGGGAGGAMGGAMGGLGGGGAGGAMGGAMGGGIPGAATPPGPESNF